MTDGFVPLSVRTGLREPFGITVGFPDYLKGLVLDLLRTAMYDLGGGSIGNADRVADRISLALRLDPCRYGRGVSGVLSQAGNSATVCLDVMDFLVRSSPGFASALEGLLTEANHEYRVDFDNECLVQRVDDSAWQVYEEACRPGGRSAKLIQEAWVASYGLPAVRDPGDAWANAVKAVEEVLKPIVSPTDSVATLGKMIAVLRDGPTKWKCGLPGDAKGRVSGLGQFISALTIVGYPPRRHGGDDREGPTEVTARAVVLQAAVILAWIGDGVLTRV